MPGPTDLQTVCQELLTASIGALNTIPDFDAELEGAPERSFMTVGQPALDCCPQLTVHVPQILTAPMVGGLEAGRQIAAKFTHVYMVVTIVRCVPKPDAKGNPPSIAAIMAAARQENADGWALWNHLYNLWTAGMLFTVCDEVFWDALRPYGPSGGCGGWTLGIHITLDGYPEAIST